MSILESRHFMDNFVSNNQSIFYSKIGSVYICDLYAHVAKYKKFNTF